MRLSVEAMRVPLRAGGIGGGITRAILRRASSPDEYFARDRIPEKRHRSWLRHRRFLIRRCPNLHRPDLNGPNHRRAIRRSSSRRARPSASQLTPELFLLRSKIGAVLSDYYPKHLSTRDNSSWA